MLRQTTVCIIGFFLFNYHSKKMENWIHPKALREIRDQFQTFLWSKKRVFYIWSFSYSKKVKMEKFDTSKVHFPYQNLKTNLVENIHNSWEILIILQLN